MDFFILVTGTDAGEREDYMTEKIREYSMNGALIIGVDNGYGNMKTARRCFKTAIAKYDSAPPSLFWHLSLMILHPQP